MGRAGSVELVGERAEECGGGAASFGGVFGGADELFEGLDDELFVGVLADCAVEGDVGGDGFGEEPVGEVELVGGSGSDGVTE